MQKTQPLGREISNNDKKKNNALNCLHSNSRSRTEQQGLLLILMYFFITAQCAFMELYKSHKNN